MSHRKALNRDALNITLHAFFFSGNRLAVASGYKWRPAMQDLCAVHSSPGHGSDLSNSPHTVLQRSRPPALVTTSAAGAGHHLRPAACRPQTASAAGRRRWSPPPTSPAGHRQPAQLEPPHKDDQKHPPAIEVSKKPRLPSPARPSSVVARLNAPPMRVLRCKKGWCAAQRRRSGSGPERGEKWQLIWLQHG